MTFMTMSFYYPHYMAYNIPKNLMFSSEPRVHQTNKNRRCFNRFKKLIGFITGTGALIEHKKHSQLFHKKHL